MSIKVRFPPSPTGYVHIGNIRSAFYNYLFAKKNNGTFILRIEDTDRDRYIDDAVESLISTLNRIGITYDEGPYIEDGKIVQRGDNGPYIQSERLDIYKKYAEKLVEDRRAYHCFCSKDRLVKLRNQQQLVKMQTKYDRHCTKLSKEEIDLKLSANEPYVLRLLIPEGETTFEDEIRGEITIDNQEIDDQVIMKSDGYPTYHLAVVVDDNLMGVTHVIRGEEWISSMPKHILLYESLGFNIPAFAHLPLILNKDKSKLSKRQGNVATEDYLKKGYLPKALLNFVALLGFNPRGDQEIYTIEELIDGFDLKKVNKSGAVFDIEKLNWMNSQYIKNMPKEELLVAVRPYLDAVEVEVSDDALLKICEIEKERLIVLSDIVENMDMYLTQPSYLPITLVWKKADEKDAKEQLLRMQDFISELDEEMFRDIPLIEEAIKGYISSNELSNGNVLWPLRVSLSGEANSPSPFELIWVFGKQESLQRIAHAIRLLSA